MDVLMDKHRINQATKKIIAHNVNNLFNNNVTVPTTELVPDASKTLIMASREQDMIGWEQWLKGRISKEWGTLVNHDVKNIDSGIKFNSSQKWAKEVINMNWEFIHDIWLIRNKTEHDEDGCPEKRAKEKLVEIIAGESIKENYVTYSEDEVEIGVLMNLPIDNLVMIERNIKNAKLHKRNWRKTMQPG
jgi:hypothetical protein